MEGFDLQIITKLNISLTCFLLCRFFPCRSWFLWNWIKTPPHSEWRNRSGQALWSWQYNWILMKIMKALTVAYNGYITYVNNVITELTCICMQVLRWQDIASTHSNEALILPKNTKADLGICWSLKPELLQAQKW